MTDARYTHGHHASVVRSHALRGIADSAAYALEYLVPGTRVLDVGCGPGTITAEIAARVAPGEVVGVDASADVIAQATALADERGIPNLRFAVGDAYALPYDDDTFDVVHAHQVLQHLGDPVAALVEWRRVTKPGGVIAVRDVDYGATAIHPPLPGLVAWLDLYRRTARADGGEPDAGRRLRDWALAAGLTDLTTSASTWVYADDAARQRWAATWAERAVASHFATSTVDHGFATPTDLVAISDAWREWGADPRGWFMFPHGELVAIV